MNEFITPDMLGTFAGLVTAVALVVQFTKGLFKNGMNDYMVRIYAFIISSVLTFIFVPSKFTPQGIALNLLNALLVTLAAMGGYEAVTDPFAKKGK